MSLSTDTTTSRLEKLGLGKAADALNVKQVLISKLEIAYKHYRYVTQDKINSFNADLRAKTEKSTRGPEFGFMHGSTFDQLKFTELSTYTEVPPEQVLDKLEAAQELRCFDAFEVAQIKSVEVRPDPILFGRVTGCEDRFYVAQWLNDVKIEDILQADDGWIKEGFTGS